MLRLFGLMRQFLLFAKQQCQAFVIKEAGNYSSLFCNLKLFLRKLLTSEKTAPRRSLFLLPMASLASSHTEANAASDHALPPSPQHETYDTVTETNASSPPDPSKEKKKKKKAEDKKITPALPKFLVADAVAPLNKKGYLKAPEPSIETSELWNS
ncbi:hypothetical protein PIB30_039204 [Stylosanthes scabra]|uniref:Uncharacterized protein n=1 Tax=Stylosanthes scabra TaxID=79078 RepID=A0ABU6QDR6_9FABA|nr:hypothetical protein [Stylosanthes scabra]